MLFFKPFGISWSRSFDDLSYGEVGKASEVGLCQRESIVLVVLKSVIIRCWEIQFFFSSVTIVNSQSFENTIFLNF
jgi:hypothetical protein